MSCDHLIKKHPLTGKWFCGKCDIDFSVKIKNSKESIVEWSYPLVDYSLCGNGLWCDFLCGAPWECEIMIKGWKEKKPEWSFEEFKKCMMESVPFSKEWVEKKKERRKNENDEYEPDKDAEKLLIEE